MSKIERQTPAVSAEHDLVFHKIAGLLRELAGAKIDITRETNFLSDIDIDSVAVLDLIMEIEDEYAISFPMNKTAEIKTVGELVDAVHELSAEK